MLHLPRCADDRGIDGSPADRGRPQIRRSLASRPLGGPRSDRAARDGPGRLPLTGAGTVHQVVDVVAVHCRIREKSLWFGHHRSPSREFLARPPARDIENIGSGWHPATHPVFFTRADPGGDGRKHRARAGGGRRTPPVRGVWWRFVILPGAALVGAARLPLSISCVHPSAVRLNVNRSDFYGPGRRSLS